MTRGRATAILMAVGRGIVPAEGILAEQVDLFVVSDRAMFEPLNLVRDELE
jgi:hypothetical protein